MSVSSFRVLLVEDDRLVARAVVRALVAAGFGVVSVPSCAAVAALRCQFDLGIFDIDLDDGSGVELADTLLAERRIQRAVFFTATTSRAERAHAAQLGLVITKAKGQDALTAAVKQLADELGPRLTRSDVVPAQALGKKEQTG